MEKILFGFLLFSLLSIQAEEQIPCFRFISPENTTVISKSHIVVRMRADYTDISYVKWFAEYTYIDEISVTMQVFRKKVYLGIDSTKPYELVWNCDTVPDQLIRLQALPFDKNNKPINQMAQKSLFILDRHKETPTVAFKSFYHNQEVVIDGSLKDWPLADSAVFQNNDNLVTAKSVWNEKYLYFAIQVLDKYIIANEIVRDSLHFYKFGKGRLKEKGIRHRLWDYDEVELCFDLKNNRHYYRDSNDLDILISPLGILQGNIAQLDAAQDSPLVWLWKGNPIFKIKVLGTINKNDDLDTGFIIETAIPWTDLNLEPVKDLKIGFDLVNVDRDTRDKRKLFLSWSHTSWLTNDNPTEWGTLILVPSSEQAHIRSVWWVLILCLFILFMIIFLKKRTRASKKEIKKSIPKKYSPRIQKALHYIDQHYSEELPIEEVTREVGLSRGYFSQVFTSEVGVPFSQHLINLRIEKAKILILQDEMSFSEIAFKVGFNSSQHFSTTFSKIVGMSPGEFKKRRRNGE